MSITTFHGTQALVAVNTANDVAYTDADQVQSVSIDYEGNVEELYQLGDRDPAELKEGTIEIGGTIERYLEAGTFSATGMTFMMLAVTDPPTVMWVAFFPEGDAAPKILVSSCKFSGYNLSSDVKGVTTERCTFRGMALAQT